MKHFLIIISVICIASLSIFMFSGCPTAPGYYIKFKVDGVEKNFDKGFTDYEKEPFGNEIGGEGTALFATPDDETGDAEPDNYIWIDFNGVDTDTYPATFLNAEIGVYLTIGGVGTDNSDCTLQVTSYGAVDGTIEGTFSGLLSDGSTITDGEFRVLRIADNTFYPAM